MAGGRHLRASWIVGALILAGAMLGGAFIVREQRTHQAPLSLSLQGEVAGVTASVQLVL